MIDQLKQHKLECNPLFRLWIIGSPKEKKQSALEVFSMCKHIYFHAPQGINGYAMQSFSSSSILALSQRSARYGKAFVCMLLFHALLSSIPEYGAHGSGWDLPYHVSQLELVRGESILQYSVAEFFNIEHLLSSFLESCECIYSGKIITSRDLVRCKTLLEYCVGPKSLGQAINTVELEEGSHSTALRLEKKHNSLFQLFSTKKKYEKVPEITCEDFGLPLQGERLRTTIINKVFLQKLHSINPPQVLYIELV